MRINKDSAWAVPRRVAGTQLGHNPCPSVKEINFGQWFSNLGQTPLLHQRVQFGRSGLGLKNLHLIRCPRQSLFIWVLPGLGWSVILSGQPLSFQVKRRVVVRVNSGTEQADEILGS